MISSTTPLKPVIFSDPQPFFTSPNTGCWQDLRGRGSPLFSMCYEVRCQELGYLMWYNLTDKDQNNVAGSYKNVARFTLYTCIPYIQLLIITEKSFSMKTLKKFLTLKTVLLSLGCLYIYSLICGQGKKVNTRQGKQNIPTYL